MTPPAPSKTVRIRRNCGDIVGPGQAAEIIGVERTRIARYAREGWMPEPIDKVGQTTLWLRKEVEAVAETIRERVGLRWSRNRDEA